MQQGDRDGANMLEKSLRILQAFRAGDRSLRLTELVARTGMPKSTVHRLSGNLVDEQLLRQTPAGFELGIRLFELSSLVPAENTLREVALPYLQDLFLATHQTVHLGIRDDLDVVYVEKIYGHSDLGLPSRVGGRLPLSATAVGKALLAFSPQEIVDDVLSRPLRRLTAHSITDPDALRRQLGEINATSLAFEVEESKAGRACVAAPVLVEGQPVAALSISVPLPEYTIAQLGPAVRTSALALGRAITAASPAKPGALRPVARSSRPRSD